MFDQSRRLASPLAHLAVTTKNSDEHGLKLRYPVSEIRAWLDRMQEPGGTGADDAR